MESLSKLGYIDDYKKVEVKADKPLEQMIKELNDEQKLYREESKIYHANMDKQLAEIKSLVKYTLTEQEEQRISLMSMSELFLEIQKNVDDMRSTIDKALERWDK